MAKHIYNLQPTVLQPNDRSVSFRVEDALKPLAKYDLDWINKIPVRDQGEQGCCTGFSEAYEQESLDLEAEKPLTIYSPAYVYALERSAVEATGLNADGGAQMRSGPVTVNRFGIVPEALFPYNDKVFNVLPSQDVMKVAVHKGSAYHQLVGEGLDTMRSCLYPGGGYRSFGFRMGINVYESFESEEVARTGLVPVPDPNREQLLGAHAVFAFGFDNNFSRIPGHTGALHIRNSWSEQWGEQGNFWLPYDAAFVINDAWMQHLGGVWG